VDWIPIMAFLALVALAIAAYFLLSKGKSGKDKPKPVPVLEGKQIVKKWAAKAAK
jgi:flagellar basal body-associated protein FliL